MIPESHHGFDGLASKVARHSGKIRYQQGARSRMTPPVPERIVGNPDSERT